MRWKKKFLLSTNRVNLYCITSEPTHGLTYSAMVDQMCRAGADIIQFRPPSNLTDKEVYIQGKLIRQITRIYKVLFILNNRVDLALLLNTDGVHIGQNDLPVKQIQRFINKFHPPLNHEFILGISTHSLHQAMQAVHDGADYISVGPVFTTPTKPDYPPVGITLLTQVRKKVTVPIVAIGGLDRTNMSQVISTGVNAVAFVRATVRTGNVYQSTKRIKLLLNKTQIQI